MSRRGIDAVDLIDIQEAAGQRNRGVVHYYFRDRQGLVLAIVNKHREPINRARHERLDLLEAGESISLGGLVEAAVRPLAESLGSPSGRDYLVIHAELATRFGSGRLYAPTSIHTDSVPRMNDLIVLALGGSGVARLYFVEQANMVIPLLLADLARMVNRRDLTVGQAMHRVDDVVEFVTRGLTPR